VAGGEHARSGRQRDGRNHGLTRDFFHPVVGLTRGSPTATGRDVGRSHLVDGTTATVIGMNMAVA